MTNHPRRAGRRKYQRQAARVWTDLTPHVSSVRLGNGKSWKPAYLGIAPAGTPLHKVHVHIPQATR